jgi:hypothetical protein
LSSENGSGTKMLLEAQEHLQYGGRYRRQDGQCGGLKLLCRSSCPLKVNTELLQEYPEKTSNKTDYSIKRKNSVA